MRWLVLFILAYFLLAANAALAGFISVGGAAPSLVFPLLVFVLLNAPRDHALSAAFVLGLMQDLLSQQPPGLHAFAFGLAAMFTIGARPAGAFRDSPFAHAALTFLAAAIAGAILCFNSWAYPRLHSLPRVSLSLAPMLLSALLTAALAPLLIYPLVRCKPLFGFRPDRSSARSRR